MLAAGLFFIKTKIIISTHRKSVARKQVFVNLALSPSYF